MLAEPRYLSIEQAAIVTEYYRANPGKPRGIQRAEALAETLRKVEIRIDPLELIVGNRTAGVRTGVVSPEAGISWLNDEIERLPERPQDKFEVRPEDVTVFRRDILPFWKGKSLEDKVNEALGDELAAIGKVAKINQTDHAQGHICPDTKGWLAKGPRVLRDDALARAAASAAQRRDFYRGMAIALDGAIDFLRRYADLARTMAADRVHAEHRANLEEIARICDTLSREPPSTFREAVQALWFLFVLLQAESNASSFSPGRADQYLYPYYERDIAARDTGRRGGARDHRGPLAQVQPDRIPAQLEQRQVLRGIPYRLQRRHRRPGRPG